MIRITGAIGGGLESRFRYAREVADAFWRKRDDVLLEMDLWLDWWRDVALARHGLDRFVTNIGWLPALSALGKALDDQAISSAASSVAGTKRALQANANARLALEVMMLDLPEADPGTFSGQAGVPEGATGSVAASG
jgi:DNA polymerase-3 subunit delta'